MKRSILIKQRDITDCGAACLASISAHYKLKLPVSRIRQTAGTDQKGTNALGMLEAAEQLGFEGKGVRGDMSALPDVPVPCIAHIVIKNRLHHYVVVYKITKNDVHVMDPAVGRIIKHSKEQFEEIWSGVLLLLSPAQISQRAIKKFPYQAGFYFC